MNKSVLPPAWRGPSHPGAAVDHADTELIGHRGWKGTGFLCVSKERRWRNMNDFFNAFFRAAKRQHKNTDTNPCQSVLRASQNQAPTLSIQESPAAALNLSSGNAGSCCKGWYPCFWLVVKLFTNLQNSFRFPWAPGNRREKSEACTGIHGFLSAKAAFRPEYSRYTWQMEEIESFHGVSGFSSPYIYIA